MPVKDIYVFLENKYLNHDTMPFFIPDNFPSLTSSLSEIYISTPEIFISVNMVLLLSIPVNLPVSLYLKGTLTHSI
jgi:hypothetical protein